MADFMASMFGPLPGATRRTPRDRWRLLVKAIIEVFCARWSPSAAILGIRDTRQKVVHLNSKALAALGVTFDSAATLPDVIVHHKAKKRLLLIEAVINAGPVDDKRREELKDLFAGCKAHLVFVTAFENRRTMQTFGSHIAWESEVWIAEDPDHMIHFNRGRFLGPYPDVRPAKP
ncbi:MAG: BsuBI/PstI family type II restriction endonuclease [Chthoniobacteraceae bacterium]